MKKKVNKNRIGNCYAFFRDENGDPWVTIGPNYIFCIILYIFITGLTIVLINILRKANPDYWYFQLVALGVILFCYISLSWTVFLNPGHPSNKDKIYQIPHSRMCRKCNVPKSKNIYHWDIWDVCVEDYDHHCPWMGKCIGSGNVVPFYFFLLSLCLLLFATFLSASLILRPDENNKKSDKMF